MKRICCSEYHVGQRYYGDKEPFENQDETHGFCDSCLPLELKKIEEVLNATTGQTNSTAQ
jgi:hypothetical protein